MDSRITTILFIKEDLIMEQNSHFTKTEWKIYQYILSHLQQITSYSLRQLALKINVSPASVVRTIQKMGFKHYSDLCRQLKKENQLDDVIDDVTYQAKYYFNQPIIESYDKQIQIFKELTSNCKDFLFFGIGTSSDLAAYGARQFANNGQNSFVIKDPFYPIQKTHGSYKDKALIVLSVSGETPQVIEPVLNFQSKGAKVISITNSSDNTISKLSDLNFCYLLESKIVSKTLNVTTQVPVVYILERLSRALNSL
ncbi:MurR/RpiR family transcriptional regulator [Xylocopilactobacillus apis]|uniref:RpiR family transcriptional regulator n=1 Tax=Xylocopilactobacillus apis TaxID=2932183 RepID=A0AAU9CX49_9LACO|nr:MurR/RpiR family transcriptional regulator [Xylocopilactobacillus apis]BDR55944.1 RpiR family transcriptional regulator [Xylocopilactobacillus apis]